jgi:hypothetical protein
VLAISSVADFKFHRGVLIGLEIAFPFIETDKDAARIIKGYGAVASGLAPSRYLAAVARH